MEENRETEWYVPGGGEGRDAGRACQERWVEGLVPRTHASVGIM